MTKYVILHKLNRGFKRWEFEGSYEPKDRQTVPHMTEEFCDWYRENQHLIKTVHSQRMVEMDRTQIAFEFHNEEEALMCMLRFA